MHFHNYFEILSLLTGIYFISKLRNTFFGYFLPYLAMVTGVELICNDRTLDNNLANWLYTFSNTASYFFFSYIIYKLARDRAIRRTVIAFGLVFIVLAVVFMVLYQSRGVIQIMLFTSVAMILFSCLYFYHTLKSDDDDITYIPGMWVTAGLLIFYSGIIITFSMFDYIAAHDLTLFGSKLYNVIPKILSVILYSCFSISFALWKPPATRS